MIWEYPEALIGLVVLPAIFFVVGRWNRRRNQKINAVFSDEMRDLLFTPKSRVASLFKSTCLFLALAAFICALAQPRYGKEPETRKILGRDVFVLFDVSDSMLAEDVSPNRLAVAKLDVEDLLDAAVGDRIGLVAFAGSAQVEIPLTTDYEFFRELLRKIDPQTVRLGGTAIGDAIRLALKRFGFESERKRLIVLITDGEDHDSLPIEAAKNAAEMNVPILAIAIGSPEGAKIPVFDVNGEKTGYKMYDGKEAISKPDVKTLKEIASISGGRYFYADSRLNLADVYRASVELQDRGVISEESRIALKDRYQPFLACGLILFMLYYFFPEHFSYGAVRNRSPRQSHNIALLLAVFLATTATAQGESPSAIQDTKTPVNERREVQAYNEALKLESADKDGFEARLDALKSANDKEVAERANFNLAVAQLKRALKDAEELATPVAKNGDEESKIKSDQAANQNPSNENEDVVLTYLKEKQERDEARLAIQSSTAKVAREFFRASKNRKLGRDAELNAESASLWSSRFREQEREREATLRAKALPDPNDRLRWLKKDLSEKLDSTFDLEHAEKNADYYRSVEKNRQNVIEWEPDVESVADGLCDALKSSEVSTSSQPESHGSLHPVAAPQSPDEEGIEKIARAKKNFLQNERNAAGFFARGSVDEARKEMRRAESQLSTFHDVPTPYKSLVSELLKSEEDLANHSEKQKEDVPSGKDLDDYHWSRDSLGLSVEEMMRKARRVVEAATPNGVESVRDAPTSDPKTDSSPDSSDEDGEELTFDSNDASDQLLKSSKTPEEREFQSAQTALKYERELKDVIEKAGSLSDENADFLSNRQELQAAQRRISDILREIYRPFQDDDQQTQDKQNQNQGDKQDQSRSNDDDDSENQSQNRQNQDSRSQDADSQHDSAKEDIPDQADKNERPREEKKREEKPESEGRDGLESPSEIKDQHEKEEKNASKREETEEQKKAEELARRVEKRQKDAARQRDAVRRALKKREKSGKDW